MSGKENKERETSSGPLTIPDQGIIAVKAKDKYSFIRSILAPTTLLKDQKEAMDDAARRAKEIFDRILEVKGISGEHALISKGNVQRGMWGSLKGEWFLNQFLFFKHGEGHIDGKLRTVSSLQFAWRPKPDQIVITEIPMDKLIFKGKENIEKPSVSFDINLEEFIKISRDRVLTWDIRVYSNPNDYLQDEKINKATINVSLAQLNSLKMLPVKIEKQ